MTKRRLRSQDWFDNPDHADMTALYLERFMNYGLTPEELTEGRPIIGIAQSGSDLAPCNRHHIDLAKRVRDGIRDAGGIPIEFPTHPVFENCRRPTSVPAFCISRAGSHGSDLRRANTESAIVECGVQFQLDATGTKPRQLDELPLERQCI